MSAQLHPPTPHPPNPNTLDTSPLSTKAHLSFTQWQIDERLFCVYLNFQLLQENIFSFVKKELQKFKMVLSPDYSKCYEGQSEDKQNEEERWNSTEPFLKITQHFLRKIGQEVLADCLYSSKCIFTEFTYIWESTDHK